MHNSIKFFLLFLLFTSCENFKKIDCRGENWEYLGYRDGLSGKAQESGLIVKNTCEQRSYEVSLKEYKTGWLQGIEKYCSAKSAFKLGLANSYANERNCPVEMQPKFEKNYNNGLDLLETINKRDLYENKGEIDSLEEKKNNLSNGLIL